MKTLMERIKDIIETILHGKHIEEKVTLTEDRLAICEQARRRTEKTAKHWADRYGLAESERDNCRVKYTALKSNCEYYEAKVEKLESALQEEKTK